MKLLFVSICAVALLLLGGGCRRGLECYYTETGPTDCNYVPLPYPIGGQYGL